MLRAACSFFDRIFSHTITSETSILDEDVEGVLVKSETDGGSLSQVTFTRIDSHSIQSLVNFAYTGFVHVETDALKKTIDDMKLMNARSMIDILESRLNEDVAYANCIPNLIIAESFSKHEVYRDISIFILKEFFLGLSCSNVGTGPSDVWQNYIKPQLHCPEMASTVVLKLEKEMEKTKPPEEKHLLNILIKLFKIHSLSKDEETELIAFLVVKKREKCGIHLEKILLYCCEDNQELCIKCLNDGHFQHGIQPIGMAKRKQMLPYWERLDSELDQVKCNSKLRISEIDLLTDILSQEKFRDVRILKGCFSQHQSSKNLSRTFLYFVI